MASGTQRSLQGVDYLGVYGAEPSAIEQVFAIYANVVRVDEAGTVLNGEYAERRATDWLRFYLRNQWNPAFAVDPPYEDWETQLYDPAAA